MLHLSCYMSSLQSTARKREGKKEREYIEIDTGGLSLIMSLNFLKQNNGSMLGVATQF